MAFLGAMIGLNISLFVMGLVYLFKGNVKFKDGSVAYGMNIRLGALCMLLILPVIIVYALIATPDSESVLARTLVVMTSLPGIAIALIGLVASMALIYTAPRQ